MPAERRGSTPHPRAGARPWEPRGDLRKLAEPGTAGASLQGSLRWRRAWWGHSPDAASPPSPAPEAFTPPTLARGWAVERAESRLRWAMQPRCVTAAAEAGVEGVGGTEEGGLSSLGTTAPSALPDISPPLLGGTAFSSPRRWTLKLFLASCCHTQATRDVLDHGRLCTWTGAWRRSCWV